jgi:hypothetical protein
MKPAPAPPQVPADECQQVSRWRRSEQTAIRLLILIALSAITAPALLEPVSDPDVWWHLRTGQWIVENGTVPSTDPFSAYGQGKTWVAYSWLFEVLVHGFHRWLGLAGIVLLRVVVGLALLAAIYRLVARREPSFARGAALVALAFVALVPLLIERSWLFSILFYTLTLDVVLTLRESRPRWTVLLLPLLYAVWANVHVQFVNGFVLLGLACVAPLLDRAIGLERSGQYADTAGTRSWWTLVGVTGACVLATLLNPYGLRLYATVIELPTQAGAFRLISELQSLTFRHLSDWAVLALFGLAAFALGRRQLSTFEILLLISSAYLSFRARRDVWLVVLAALAILVTSRPRLGEADARAFVLTPWRSVVVAGGVLVLYAVVAWRSDLGEDHLRDEVAAHFPAKAAAAIEEHAWAGPLYNDYNWGGYLLWRLPSLPVAMDGRANLHGDERMQRSADTWKGLPGWDTDQELAAAGIVIAPVKYPLTSLLRLDRRFRVGHEDEVAVVFVARRAAPDQRPPD